jgi:hypothetical protein
VGSADGAEEGDSEEDGDGDEVGLLTNSISGTGCV